MRPDPHTILAIDPGTREIGFAVLRREKLLAYGVRSFRTLSKRQRPRAIKKLAHAWIEAYRPGTLVLEHTHHHSVPWLDAIHRVAKSLARDARRSGAAVASYHPSTVRRLLAGNGWATKRELAAAIVLHFPALRAYVVRDLRWRESYFSNLFDAVALALYHEVRYR